MCGFSERLRFKKQFSSGERTPISGGEKYALSGNMKGVPKIFEKFTKDGQASVSTIVANSKGEKNNFPELVLAVSVKKVLEEMQREAKESLSTPESTENEILVGNRRFNTSAPLLNQDIDYIMGTILGYEQGMVVLSKFIKYRNAGVKFERIIKQSDTLLPSIIEAIECGSIQYISQEIDETPVAERKKVRYHDISRILSKSAPTPASFRNLQRGQRYYKLFVDNSSPTEVHKEDITEECSLSPGSQNFLKDIGYDFSPINIEDIKIKSLSNVIDIMYIYGKGLYCLKKNGKILDTDAYSRMLEEYHIFSNELVRQHQIKKAA